MIKLSEVNLLRRYNMISAIRYYSENGILPVNFTPVEEHTMFGNALCTMIQYCLERPKLMKYIKNKAKVSERLKTEKSYQQTIKLFPIIQEKEVGIVVQFFSGLNESQYRSFLEKNIKRVYKEYMRSERFGSMFMVRNALDVNTDIYEDIPIIAFMIWLVYVNADNEKFILCFENERLPKLVIMSMIETFGYYANMEKEAQLIKANSDKYKLPYYTTQEKLMNTDKIAGELTLFNHVISMLTKPARSYEKSKITNYAINIINNHFDYYWDQLSDTKNDEVYHVLKYAIATISPLIDDYNYLQSRYIGDTTPHEYISDQLSKELVASKQENARLQSEIARLQAKLDEANKANAQLPTLQEKVSWLEDENRFLQDRISEQITFSNENRDKISDEDINQFINLMNTYKIGLVGGNDEWQDRVSRLFDIDIKVTELNKVSGLKNCDIILINTGFISHTLYFSVKSTAKNAIFMYVDNLNTDILARNLYLKYSNSI